MEKPIYNKKIKLEKFEGKGGWTFARLKGIRIEKKTGLSWHRVKGSIDSHVFPTYNLFPFANGEMLFAVKKEIRKKIGKEAGDTVHIILYHDNEPLHIPGEFLECLRDEPKAYKYFFAFTEGKKKQYIEWIYDAKREDTRIARMAAAIERISQNKPLQDQKKPEE